jgi:hypothetical protein
MPLTNGAKPLTENDPPLDLFKIYYTLVLLRVNRNGVDRAHMLTMLHWKLSHFVDLAIRNCIASMR